jgi:outer membrane protein OmpA-like peptidoglycan-associated protein
MLGGTAPALLLLAAATVALAQDEPATPYEQVRELQQAAKKAGAKGQLPHAWWDLDSRLKEARDNGTDDAGWEALESDARRLLNMAVFVDDMRRQKSGLEAMLGRFDQSLHEIATLFGVRPDPELTGRDLAVDLQDSLAARYLSRQVLVDSLTVENRRFRESLGSRAAAQESLITALQVEVTALRKQLWETELRAGVAEADRSAAETVLSRKQAREAAIDEVRSAFTEDEAEILLTGSGDIVMRVFGLSFDVGSAELSAGQEPLLDRIAASVDRFPGAIVRIEGHTDDTGNRQANQRLSRRRAESVARLLEIKMGRQLNELATEGYGPDRPIGPNSTVEGRAKNRRIDVVITPGS